MEFGGDFMPKLEQDSSWATYLASVSLCIELESTKLATLVALLLKEWKDPEVKASLV